MFSACDWSSEIGSAMTYTNEIIGLFLGPGSGVACYYFE